MATLHSRPVLHSYYSVRGHMMYGSSVILCYSLVLVTGITNIAIATVGQAAPLMLILVQRDLCYDWYAFSNIGSCILLA